MDAQEISRIAAQAAFDKKGEEIKCLYIEPLTTLADCFVLVKATSYTQAKAIADEVEYQLKERGQLMIGADGDKSDTGWILLDFSSVMVHIFYDREELYENMSRLWADAEEREFTLV